MDWIALITKYLDAFLMRCFDQVSSETPQEYIRSFYDPVSEKLHSSIVQEAMPATRRAVVKARQSLKPRERRDLPRYSRDEIYQMAETRLILAMNAPEEQIVAARAMAATMGDD